MAIVFFHAYYSEHKALQAEALQFVEQGPAADAERLGGFRAVVFVLPQGQQDRLPLDFVQRLGIGYGCGRKGFKRFAQFGWQMFRQNQLALRQQHGAFDEIAQFADVARPGVIF